MKKFLLISFSVLAVVAGILLYLFVFRGNAQNDYKSVEINGKTMKAHIGGSGDKTVVMLSGWGVDSPVDDFYPIYTELSKDYKVVVLEYFGYGASDVTDDKRTNENMVEEIRAALNKLEIKPPYILMPHSMSGLYSLCYANKYPSEVSAIIGLDMSLPQKQLERWNESNFEKITEENNEHKFNNTIVSQWNEFYNNSKKLEGVKYPQNLPVLSFLATEQINSVNSMIESGEMKTSWFEINQNMITNPKIQKIEIIDGHHNSIMYDSAEKILESSKRFIDSL